MLKRMISIALLLALLCLPALGEEEKDFSAYDDLMARATEALKAHWTQRYAESRQKRIETSGLLDIRASRLIVIKEELSERAAGMLEKLLGRADVRYLVLFWGYVDEFGGGDDYYDEINATAGGNCAAFFRDGSVKITRNVLELYRTRTYEPDFGGIIREVVDLGDHYSFSCTLPEKKDGMKEMQDLLDQLLNKVN